MGIFGKKLKQEHKVMLQAERAGGELLTEYHRATPECPNPQLWSMFDSMTAEVEVLEFLTTLVTTVKPKLIVETGAFLGVSAVELVEEVELGPLAVDRDLGRRIQVGDRFSLAAQADALMHGRHEAGAPVARPVDYL